MGVVCLGSKAEDLGARLVEVLQSKEKFKNAFMVRTCTYTYMCMCICTYMYMYIAPLLSLLSIVVG